VKLRIRETQDVKVLEIRGKNGIEWTNDLLGNYNALQYNDITEEYEMNQDDYEWWSEYIKNREADEQEVIELAGELGIEESEIWERIDMNLVCDLGDEHMIIQNILEEIRKEV
jgi:hypothetical protein